jgi:hypothetical protein
MRISGRSYITSLENCGFCHENLSSVPIFVAGEWIGPYLVQSRLFGEFNFDIPGEKIKKSVTCRGSASLVHKKRH